MVFLIPWWVHPLWQSATVILVLINFRIGTRFGSQDGKGPMAKDRRQLRRVHTAVGILAVALLVVGFVLGVIGQIELGGMPFTTLHGFIGMFPPVLFVLGLLLGWRLYQGKKDARYGHHTLMRLGVFLVLVQIATGALLLGELF